MRELREYQRNAVSEITKAIKEGAGVVVLNAPTGSGKTAMSIAVARELGAEKVLVLVRTHNEEEPFWRDARWVYPRARVVGLRSKNVLCMRCIREGGRCDDDTEFRCSECEEYERVVDAYEAGRLNISLVTERSPATPPSDLLRLLTFKSSAAYCPYQYVKYTAKHLWRGDEPTILVAPYPYLFVDFVRKALLSIFEAGGDEDDDLGIGDVVLPDLVIIDEAHNLDNVASLLERVVSRSIVDRVVNQITREVTMHPSMKSRLANSVSAFWGEVAKALPRETGGRLRRVDLGVIANAYSASNYEELREAFENASNLVRGGAVRRNYVASWVRTMEMVREVVRSGGRTERWGVVGTYSDGSRLLIKPVSVDVVIRDGLNQLGGAPVLMMSGTMPSMKYIETAWGVRVGAYIDLARTVRVGSWDVRVVSTVTTAYRERSDGMMRRIADEVANIVRNSRGVCLVVYPSYEVMERVSKTVIERTSGSAVGGGKITDWTSGVAHVSSRDVKSIVELSRKVVDMAVGGTVVVHAVARDALTEGVEITKDGKSLISTVVVVGIPYPDVGDDYLMDRVRLFTRSGGSRHMFIREHAVMAIRQAVGRAVRGPNDTATIYFLDSRYSKDKWWVEFVTKLRNMGFARHG